jgi:hypothetical protein
MATRSYCQKYRKLKSIYEDTYQKSISDISWYRLVAQLKQFMNFSIDSPNAAVVVKTIANMKRSHRNFRISSDNFGKCWEIFQHYYQQKKQVTCAEFLADLSQRLDLDLVSKTSIYNWFTKAGMPYRHEKKYSTSDLALVAFQAAKCLKSREMKQVEKAVTTINVLAMK